MNKKLIAGIILLGIIGVYAYKEYFGKSTGGANTNTAPGSKTPTTVPAGTKTPTTKEWVTAPSTTPNQTGTPGGSRD